MQEESSKFGKLPIDRTLTLFKIHCFQPHFYGPMIAHVFFIEFQIQLSVCWIIVAFELVAICTNLRRTTKSYRQRFWKSLVILFIFIQIQCSKSVLVEWTVKKITCVHNAWQTKRTWWCQKRTEQETSFLNVVFSESKLIQAVVYDILDEYLNMNTFQLSVLFLRQQRNDFSFVFLFTIYRWYLAETRILIQWILSNDDLKLTCQSEKLTAFIRHQDLLSISNEIGFLMESDALFCYCQLISTFLPDIFHIYSKQIIF